MDLLRNKILLEKIQNLYKTNDYYVSFKNNKKIDSVNYWSQIKDPDGLIRKRNSNREYLNYKKNVKYIIKDLNDLISLKNKNIFDIGCGIGFMLKIFLENGSSIKQLSGCEIDAFQRNISSKYGQIFETNIENLRITKKFDIIIAHHVIEHIKKPEVLINKAKKMLKKEGILVIATPDFDSAMSRRYKENFRMFHDSTHVSFFSNDSMHRFLRNKGLKIKKVTYPFFETSYFNIKNLNKLFSKSTISPPFYGSFMTFYCKLK